MKKDEKDQKNQGVEHINHGTDEEMELYGFQVSGLKRFFTWLAIILTLGFLRLVFYWKPEWMTKCTHSRCHIRDATTVLLRDKYQQWFVETVEILRTNTGDSQEDLDSLNMSKSSAKHRQPVSACTVYATHSFHFSQFLVRWIHRKNRHLARTLNLV